MQCAGRQGATVIDYNRYLIELSQLERSYNGPIPKWEKDALVERCRLPEDNNRDAWGNPCSRPEWAKLPDAR